MESRKYQLQKQIIEAIKANDNDLYSLLKSQWAHRYGVESLEEFKNLDLSQTNQNVINENNQQIPHSNDDFFEEEQSVFVIENDNQDQEKINEDTKEIEPVEFDNKQSFEIKSYEKFDKENLDNKDVNPIIDYKNTPKVEALIPLPPKPKYSYLNKWLVRNR